MHNGNVRKWLDILAKKLVKMAKIPHVSFYDQYYRNGKVYTSRYPQVSATKVLVLLFFVPVHCFMGMYHMYCGYGRYSAIDTHIHTHTKDIINFRTFIIPRRNIKHTDVADTVWSESMRSWTCLSGTNAITTCCH